MLAALLAACDGGTGPQVGDLYVRPAVLAARGDTVRLSAWANGSVVGATWESLDTSVVRVTGDGLATATGAGTARVRARFGGVEAQGAVDVLPPVDIRVSELALVTDPAGVQGIRMRIRNHGGRGYYALELWKLDPDGTKRRLVFYTTEAEAAPGLDIEHSNYLSAEAPDWVVVYSREPLAREPVRTACVRVDGLAGCPSDSPDVPVVHSVLVTPAAHVFQVGDSVLYRATAYDVNGAEITGRSVTWHTPSPDIVRVDERGMATALAVGYGQVEATIDGVGFAVGLTVTEAEQRVDSVWVGPESATVSVGDTVRYTARAFDANGTELTGLTVRWSTSTPTVVSLSEGGVATALAAGQGVVIVTVADFSTNVGITVRPVVDQLSTYSVGILFIRETIQFRGLALDERGVPVDGVEVEWTSSNPAVLEADPDGTMRALAAGSAVVEAVAGDKRKVVTVRVASAPADALLLSLLPEIGDAQLQVRTLGASGSWQTVHHAGGLREPVASPDGRRFAFVGETQDGGRDLFLVNADGTGLERLTTNPGPDDQPAWSPDGRSIAFRSIVNGLADIWIIGVDGSGLRNLTALGDVRIESLGAERPAWSPDGQWVVYAWGVRNMSPARSGLRMSRLDGSEARFVTALGSFEDTEPSFSPSGYRIVFRRTGAGMVNRIMMTDLSGNLVNPGADLGTGRTPRWSPDGEWLVYVRPDAVVTGPGALILKRIGWEEERQLGSALDVAWTPVD